METLPADRGSEANSGSACCICLDDLDHRTTVCSLACGHIYHEACLARAQLASHRCPMCRTPVDLNRVKHASQVPGACASRGDGYRGYALRSAAPPPQEQRHNVGAAPGRGRDVGAAPTAAWQDRDPLAELMALDAQRLVQRQVQAHGQAQQQQQPDPPAGLAQAQMEPRAQVQARMAAPLPPQGPVPPASQQAQHRDWRVALGRLLHPSAPQHAGQADWRSEQAPQRVAAAPAPAPQQAAQPATQPASSRPRTDATGAPPATDIPAADVTPLLNGISLLNAAAAGGAPISVPDQLRQLLGAGVPPNTWAFCIDLSSSMGSCRAWRSGATSRLCFALASVACMVDSKVATGDWVLVVGFDAGLATLHRWHRKPADFDRVAFLAQLTGAVRHSGLERFGTNACAAVQAVVADLAAQAAALEGPQAAAAGPGSTYAAGTTPPPPFGTQQLPWSSQLSQSHSLVFLTDGWADDAADMLQGTAALLRMPPFPHGGFRSLLLHIDARPQHSDTSGWLRELAQDSSGGRLPYAELSEMSMPASLDVSSLSSAAAVDTSPAVAPTAANPAAAGPAAPGTNPTAPANPAANPATARVEALLSGLYLGPIRTPTNPGGNHWRDSVGGAAGNNNWLDSVGGTGGADIWRNTGGGVGAPGLDRWGAPHAQDEEEEGGGRAHATLSSMYRMSRAVHGFSSNQGSAPSMPSTWRDE